MRFFSPKRIYLDYASAPPVLPEARKAMHEAELLVGNPGAIHSDAVEAKASLEDAREIIAAELACKAREIIFTSGLTESNNLAILGHARALERIKRSLARTHWIVSAIEHPSVLECFSEIERLGGTVEHLAPDSKGTITEESLKAMLRPETVFVSIGWANHEIGTVQPLSALSRLVRAYGKEHGIEILLHSDAGQAPLYRSPQVHTLGVDLFTLGSNKLQGPHGAGALYVSNRAQIASVITGGDQERGLRPGTQNVALAVGFAVAVQASANDRISEAARIMTLREQLLHGILKELPDTVVNGGLRNALPHILNISVPDIDSEYIALALDRDGIALSTKSACNEGESSSHVVAAISPEKWRAQNTLRISLGRESREKDMPRVAQALSRHVALFRERKML